MGLFLNLKFNPILSVQAAVSDEEIEQELGENIDNILDDVESSELDDYIDLGFDVEFLNKGSFKDIVVSVLNGNYFNDYDGLWNLVLDSFKDKIKGLISLFVMFIAIALLHEMFNNFCVDRYSEIKKSVRIIF